MKRPTTRTALWREADFQATMPLHLKEQLDDSIRNTPTTVLAGLGKSLPNSVFSWLLFDFTGPFSRPKCTTRGLPCKLLGPEMWRFCPVRKRKPTRRVLSKMLLQKENRNSGSKYQSHAGFAKRAFVLLLYLCQQFS